MVGGIQMICQWEGTVSMAIEGTVTWRGHDPVIPPYIIEIHIQRMPSTIGFMALAWSRFGLTFLSLMERVAHAIMPKSDQ